MTVMKHIIILCFLSVCAWEAQAQESADTTQAEDTLVYSDFLKVYSSSDRSVRFSRIRTRWFLLDLGFDFLNPQESYVLDNGIDPFEQRIGKSTNVNIHLVQQKMPFAKGHMAFKYGLSLNMHKYMFDNPVVWDDTSPQVNILFDEEERYRKYRYSNTYLTVPVMLNFSSNPRRSIRSFYLGVGGYAGVLLSSNFKVKGGGDKDKERDNFHVNIFRYGLRGEIGFGPVVLYTQYALNEMFQEEENGGFVLNPFSVGIQIWPF